MRSVIAALLIAMLNLLPTGVIASTGAMDDRAPEQTALPEGAFLDSPAKWMAAIYKDYHDWQVDKGIMGALSALEEIDALYARDPRGVIADSSLKLNNAYQVKSTLHTMLGMLYYRKSMLVLRGSGTDAEQALMDKIRKGDEVSEEDLERVAEEAERGSSSRLQKDNLMAKALSQFKLASDTDPLNPSPHYQMASVYSAMPPVESANMAEQEYYRGAELSIREGQRDTARGAIEAIRNINPGSVYISRIEKLLADK